MKNISYLLIVGIFISCKKDKAAPSPNEDCRIITASNSFCAIHFTYDDKGRIATRRVMPDNDLSSYKYGAGNNTYSTTNQGNFLGRVFFELNDRGFATKVRQEYDAQGTKWTNQAMQYDGDELKKITITTSEGPQVNVTEYEWKNGDMVRSVTNGTAVATYEYYEALPWRAGDWRHLQELFQGYKLFKHTHMIKAYKTSGDQFLFTYQIETDGQVKKILSTSNGAGDEEYDYSYECE